MVMIGLRVLAPSECRDLTIALSASHDNGSRLLPQPSNGSLLPPDLASLVAEASRLAHSLPRCVPDRVDDSAVVDVQESRYHREPTAPAGDDREVGELLSEEMALQAALSTTARAEAKVVSRVSSAVATRLKTRFLILIILFIKYVVIPEFLCPPVTDGIMGFLGPTVANVVVVPMVQGVIETSSPKFQNMLGKVIGVFLGLICFLKLTVVLTLTLGDGITYVITDNLNRQIPRVVTNFVNLHMATAETFMVLHETLGLVGPNVVNRLGLSLTHALTHSVTHTVTHRILHHYYCIYCYYFGNFCDFCYRYDELTYMHRLWGFGQGKNEQCASPRSMAEMIAARHDGELPPSTPGLRS